MGERSEIFGCRKDGTQFPAEASISKLEINGEKYFTTILRDISERKLAEEALRRYERMVSATADAMVLVDRNYIYQVANQTYLAWHKKQYEEIVGHSISEIMGADVFENFLKEHLDCALAGETVGWQTWVKLAVGRRFVSVTYSPYFEADNTISGLVASISDITELKQTEERLRQTNQEMQAIFAAFPDILFRVAADGTILDYKTKQDDNLYTSPEMFLGKRVQDVLPPPVGQNIQAEVGRVLETDSPVSLEYSLPMPDGEQYFEARMVRFQDNEVIAVTRNISDRKLAEERLRQSESQLNTIITTTSDGIMILDREGKVRFANPAATALLNRSVDEFVDYPWGIPLGEIAEIEVVVSRDEIRTVEMKATQTQWLGESAYVLALRDISDRKRAEAALRESEEQLQLALEGSGDGFWDWNIPTGEVYLSPKYLEMLGYEADELPQEFSTWEQLIHPDDKPWVIDALNAHLADSSVPYNFDYRILTKSGEWKWIANYGKVVACDLDGTPLRMAGTHRDVSGKKLAEIKLQQAVLSAEAANRAKSTFLANMSHELRTPLNGILGYAQILQGDKNFTPKQQDGINIIYQCGTHLLTLINDILDLSKIEAEKLELYPEDVHFLTFLTELSDIFQLKAVQKDIKFTYLPCSQLPAVIQADEKRLRQVLMNLLSNAVKFTDRGRVTFKVTLIDNQQHDQSFTAKIRFQVEDTGIGIMPEQLEKIFLPFEQVGDKSRRSEGTGLGLAITQKILQMMGSQIFVESTPQVGSRFWFDVDFSLVSTPTNSTPVKSTASIVGYSGAQQKILVVDDRWEKCSVIINMLEPLGFELAEAANGQEGLKKAIEFQPDLILVDLVMPVMDGYQMTRQLRQFPEFQTTIIIAVSANAFELDRQQSLDSGCNDFISKPVQAQDLLDKIQDYLTLSWIYDNTKEFQSLGLESSDKPLSSSTEMVFPPRHELLALHQAVLMGDVEAVEYELIRLQDVGVEYMSFVIRALELAQDFDYEGIAKLIEPHLS
ncbi:MAG TPA: PAS domain S-box protein [Coleofasciculaceae cyanobacterium]